MTRIKFDCPVISKAIETAGLKFAPPMCPRHQTNDATLFKII